MSRVRRAASSPVQLFPFLAVLVSTIGALILLLLAINRQLTHQAIARAAADRANAADAREQSSRDDLEHIERDLELLASRAAESAARHESLVAATGARRSDARSARERLGAANRQLLMLRDGRGRIASEIQAARDQIAAIEDSQSRRAADSQPREAPFVPVVHPGAHGTARQPIFIECTSAGVTFQPEGVAISTSDLYHDPKAVAAFARIVLALAKYHERTHSAIEPQGAEPPLEAYPLFLIRPDGIPAYYLARIGLFDSELAFGYELLEAGWTLQFPDHDPAARQVAEAARHAVPARPAGRALAMGERWSTVQNVPAAASVIAPGASHGGQEGAAAVQHDGGVGISSAPRSGPAGELTTGAAGNPRGSPEEWGKDGAFGHAAPSSEREDDRELAASPQAGTTPSERDEAQPGAAGGRAEGPAQQGAGQADSPGLDGELSDRIPTARLAARKIPIRRRIELECSREQLVIRSHGTRIRLSAGREAAAYRELAAAIEREASSWGPAGTTFYWEPQVVCLIRGGALETYYGLRQAMMASGIALDHVIVLEPDGFQDDWLFLNGSVAEE